LRASELVAIVVEDIIEAIDPDARLLTIRRSKGNQEGEGATAYLSPRTVRAIAAWADAAGFETGAVFRRVNVRRYKARAAVRGRSIDSISSRETWDLRKTLPKPAVPARVSTMLESSPSCLSRSDLPCYDPAGIRCRRFVRADDGRPCQAAQGDQRTFDPGRAEPRPLASGEDLAGIMDALRLKSPQIPLTYNRI
jgi:hypothetical protein